MNSLNEMDDKALRAYLVSAPLEEVLAQAAQMRDSAHGSIVSYSRKVFIPLTQLCRDVCHYCTFAKPPRAGLPAFLTPEQVLEIARAGERAGCQEALFTLGDKPELRYRVAREALASLGYRTTIEYLAACCELVLENTSLLPHVNPGILTAQDIAALRRVSVSQGIMLENVSPRLCERGGVHFGSPDKDPALRLETIRLAGEQRVPFTSGILIGIGENRAERLDSLFALRDLHREFGHLQEVIVQNFRAKEDTKLAGAPEPDLNDLQWTIASARLVLGAKMNIQVPPNLSATDYPELMDAGINDWGGVSPVTPDHVNPEAPWPQIEILRAHTEARGKRLVERLAIYPEYALAENQWVDSKLASRLRRALDSSGYARNDAWMPGDPDLIPAAHLILGTGASAATTVEVGRALERIASDRTPAASDLLTLFGARGADVEAVCEAADALRAQRNGDVVCYVVNRNINYTNVCYFKCGFCAFSKGRLSENLRGKPYDLEIGEIVRRAVEAWERGATEVCMQGGIHPDYTGRTYLEICRAVKAELPGMHVHSFSPLEIFQGAQTTGMSVDDFVGALKDAGLGTLPGTAAEILDDGIRAVICPDKLNTAQWLSVMAAAHRIGLRSTATIMFGHVETPHAWVQHLLRVREQQTESGGFTEFVPLPFVPMEAPLYRRGYARRGPTFREVLLMHAVARLALDPLITNIQASWVKLGAVGVKACLSAGVNDLGGTLMNESISRAAGASHGQEMPPAEMDDLIRACSRTPEQRTTLYGPAPEAQRKRSYEAPLLTPVVQTPAHKYANLQTTVPVQAVLASGDKLA